VKLSVDEARRRFTEARVARLATVGASGQPHLVPVVFAVTGSTIVIAVDDKPKTTRDLRRLTNIAANPQVSLLVDHYAEDWSTLWWVRADGLATVTPDTAPVAELVVKYPQYASARPAGPVVLVDVHTWRGWSAA
jgi:PPOX class probable F420-dependent enzyme